MHNNQGKKCQSGADWGGIICKQARSTWQFVEALSYSATNNTISGESKLWQM